MHKLTENQMLPALRPGEKGNQRAETDLEMQVRLEHERKGRICGNRPLRQAVALLRARGKPVDKPDGKAAQRRKRQQERLAAKRQRQFGGHMPPPVSEGTPLPPPSKP